MGAARKIRKIKAANDRPIPSAAPRLSIITLTPTPRSIGRFAIIVVLFLGLGLMALTLFLAQKKPATLQPTLLAAVPAKEIGQPQPDNIQLPASSLAPDSPDEQTIDLVASKISDMTAIKKKDAVHIVTVEMENSQDQLVRAHDFLDAHELGNALKLYEKILAAEPNNHDALAGKIYILAETGDDRQAADMSRHALVLYPHDTALRTNLARLLAKLGQIDNAIVEQNHAAQDEPNSLPYRLDLAALYDRGGHTAEALMLYRQLVAAAGQEDAPLLPLAMIQNRIDYLANAAGPSTTSPEDNR